MKILGAVLELPAKQPIYLKIRPNWLCCFAGTVKLDFKELLNKEQIDFKDFY